MKPIKTEIPEEVQRAREHYWKRALADEMKEWETVRADEIEVLGWKGDGEFFTKDREKLGLGNPGFVLDISSGLGWLPCQGMRADGDHWSFCFEGQDVRPGDAFNALSIWREAIMPKSWHGELESLLLRGVLEPEALIGKFVDYGITRYWIDLIRLGPAPVWPTLGRGQDGELRVGEMDMLGVLWRNSPTFPKMNWGELNVAWSDKQGKFLGWQQIASMVQVRQLAEWSRCEYGPLEGYEALERELRHKSWGMEL